MRTPRGKYSEWMMRSRNEAIDDWQQEAIDGDETSEYVQDSYADLEPFIDVNIDGDDDLDEVEEFMGRVYGVHGRFKP
jgi:hypothetical protein